MAKRGEKITSALIAVFVAVKDNSEWKKSGKWHFSIQKSNLGTSTEATCLILQEGCAYPQNNVKFCQTSAPVVFKNYQACSVVVGDNGEQPWVTLYLLCSLSSQVLGEAGQWL